MPLATSHFNSTTDRRNVWAKTPAPNARLRTANKSAPLPERTISQMPARIGRIMVNMYALRQTERMLGYLTHSMFWKSAKNASQTNQAMNSNNTVDGLARNTSYSIYSIAGPKYPCANPSTAAAS